MTLDRSTERILQYCLALGIPEPLRIGRIGMHWLRTHEFASPVVALLAPDAGAYPRYGRFN